MLSTPQKRGASPNFGSPTIRVPLLKGLFADGVWHCNCAPRLPATRFQVKKEGRNKGRWFYTCQVSKEAGGCGFFLWDEEAKNREGKALMGNSTSEKPEEDSRTVAGDSMPRTDIRPAASRGESTAVKVEGSESEDDQEFGSWPFTPTPERNVVERTAMSPETPRKTPSVGAFTTPGSKRKRGYEQDNNDNEPNPGIRALPTPITGEAIGRRRSTSLSEYGNDDEDIFSTPSSLRTVSHHNSLWLRSPSRSATPLQNNFRASSPTTLEDRPAIPNPYDITSEVTNILLVDDVQLDEETEGKLKSLLGRHAMRVSGIAKGRDITRIALKSKDAKIAELGLRIGQLETEREVDKKIISGLRVERNGKG